MWRIPFIGGMMAVSPMKKLFLYLVSDVFDGDSWIIEEYNTKTNRYKNLYIQGSDNLEEYVLFKEYFDEETYYIEKHDVTKNRKILTLLFGLDKKKR